MKFTSHTTECFSKGILDVLKDLPEHAKEAYLSDALETLLVSMKGSHYEVQEKPWQGFLSEIQEEVYKKKGETNL